MTVQFHSPKVVQFNRKKYEEYVNEINDHKIMFLKSRVCYFVSSLIIIYVIYLAVILKVDFIAVRKPFVYFGIAMMLSKLGAKYRIASEEEMNAKKAIIQGTQSLSDYLDELSNNYLILNNLVIKTGEIETDVGCIIISSYGVWLINIKYYEGRLFGSSETTRWQREHISKYGIPYSDELPNPLKLTQIQSHDLENLLEDNFVKVPVHGLIMLPSVKSVSAESDDIVFTKTELIQKIESEKDDCIPDETLCRIAKVLGVEMNREE